MNKLAVIVFTVILMASPSPNSSRGKVDFEGQIVFGVLAWEPAFQFKLKHFRGFIGSHQLMPVIDVSAYPELVDPVYELIHSSAVSFKVGGDVPRQGRLSRNFTYRSCSHSNNNFLWGLEPLSVNPEIVGYILSGGVSSVLDFNDDIDISSMLLANDGFSRCNRKVGASLRFTDSTGFINLLSGGRASAPSLFEGPLGGFISSFDVMKPQSSENQNSDSSKSHNPLCKEIGFFMWFWSGVIALIWLIVFVGFGMWYGIKRNLFVGWSIGTLGGYSIIPITYYLTLWTC